MPRHLLSDVDVVAISLVDKGANLKRFFLKKQDAGETLHTLPAPHRLVKSEDWSAVYCVVAEPDWEERAGQHGDPDVMDMWATGDEIRKAAHKFMRNGALVNKMHETLDPYGQIVENFVTPVDFNVDTEVIKAGSWVVAIEPTEEGRQKIESGEFTGISIQGSGVRTLEKGQGANAPVPRKCKSCGATMSKDATKCPSCGASFVSKESSMTDGEKGVLRKFMEFLTGEDSGPVETETATVINKEATDVTDTNTSTEQTASDDRIEKVEATVEKTSKDVASLAASVAQIAQTLAEKTGDQTVDPAQEVYHRLDEVAKSIDDIREDVEKIATGRTAQPETSSTDKVEKKDPLAGLLS